jgi:hypothetical protein
MIVECCDYNTFIINLEIRYFTLKTFLTFFFFLHILGHLYFHINLEKNHHFLQKFYWNTDQDFNETLKDFENCHANNLIIHEYGIIQFI